MLKLDLLHLSRAGARALDVDVPADSPLWEGSALDFRAPVRVRLRASAVGGGRVYVTGTLATTLAFQCRRCLEEVLVELSEQVGLLFQPRDESEPEVGSAEVYELEVRQTELDLAEPVREQLLLLAPTYVVCRVDCRGLCPGCGVNLNEEACRCAAEEGDPRWEALRALKLE